LLRAKLYGGNNQVKLAKIMRIFRLHADALDGPDMRNAARERDRLLDELTMDEAALGIALARGFSKLFTR
jgi:hypothetical protein